MTKQESLQQTPDAESSGENKRSEPCVNIASPVPESTGSAEYVSPAISLAISPSTDENYKTESDGNQSSSQSGMKRGTPLCYGCLYRAGLVGDAHSECKHPSITDTDRMLTGFALLAGRRSQSMKRMNISANSHGVKSGWFYWPLNFDPVWLETCDGYTEAKP